MMDAAITLEKAPAVDAAKAVDETVLSSDSSEGYTDLFIDPAIERSYVRKMDLILLPLLSIM